MAIREMRAEDYGEVYALWKSCPGVGLNDLDDSENGVKKFLARNPGTCFVAEEEDRIVGAIMAGNDGRRGYVYHTAVHPLFRGRGIGKGLVAAAVQSLRQCGVNKVALVVFAANESGNAFWQKLGFSDRGDLIYRNKVIN